MADPACGFQRRARRLFSKNCVSRRERQRTTETTLRVLRARGMAARNAGVPPAWVQCPICGQDARVPCGRMPSAAEGGGSPGLPPAAAAQRRQAGGIRRQLFLSCAAAALPQEPPPAAAQTHFAPHTPGSASLRRGQTERDAACGGLNGPRTAISRRERQRTTRDVSAHSAFLCASCRLCGPFACPGFA